MPGIQVRVSKSLHEKAKKLAQERGFTNISTAFELLFEQGQATAQTSPSIPADQAQ